MNTKHARRTRLHLLFRSTPHAVEFAQASAFCKSWGRSATYFSEGRQTKGRIDGLEPKIQPILCDNDELSGFLFDRSRHAGVLGVKFNPTLALRGGLALPKRRTLFKINDDVAAGIEPMGAMRRPHRHQYDRFANGILAVSVQHQRIDHVPFRRSLLTYCLDVTLGHAGVMFEKHRRDVVAVIEIAHGADESDHGTVPAFGQILIFIVAGYLIRIKEPFLNNDLHDSTSRYRRKECHFVTVAQGARTVGVFHVYGNQNFARHWLLRRHPFPQLFHGDAVAFDGIRLLGAAHAITQIGEISDGDILG